MAFVDVQAQPPEPGEFLPERRPGLLLGIQEFPGRPARFLRGQEGTGDLAEFAVVVGERDGHGRVSSDESGRF